ncbi:hypothetical protein B0H11DRAFT_1944488 [Mycena galericulata]|nr:hypothetical protein B0H11DRAFT_1944488 [Mycena galericulata]
MAHPIVEDDDLPQLQSPTPSPEPVEHRLGSTARLEQQQLLLKQQQNSSTEFPVFGGRHIDKMDCPERLVFVSASYQRHCTSTTCYVAPHAVVEDGQPTSVARAEKATGQASAEKTGVEREEGRATEVLVGDQ